MSKLYVVSAGAVTGLGFDLPASVAAMHAKLDNFKETEFVNASNENYIGAYIPSDLIAVDHPSHGIAKLRSLLKRAVLESLSRLGYTDKGTSHVNAPYGRWGVIFVLSVEYANQTELLTTLLRDIPILAEASFNEIAIGSSGAGIAINTARSLLNTQKIDAVLIVSIDTWLEPHLIRQGMRFDRLLDDINGIGCIPAEAAVAVILSSRPYIENCPMTIAGFGIGIGHEPVLLMDTDKTTMGRGLRDAYRQALFASNLEMTNLHLRIGDVTGEEYFFSESINGYGSVLEGTMPKGYETLFTSSYLGDVKAASGLFSVAYVWQLAQSGQFNSKFAVSHMSSPTHSERTVIILEAGKKIIQPLLISDIILPSVVQQHIEESSLYWLRQYDALWHPNMTPYDIRRFKVSMQRHLDGLRIAGRSGTELALKQLERWRSTDEVFVALYSYFHCKERRPQDFERILAVLNDEDISYQGVTAAIANTSIDLSEKFVDSWWQYGTEKQRSAIFAIITRYLNIPISESIIYGLKSAYSPLRKQALKFVGESLLYKYNKELKTAFMYEKNALCKIEAACSLALLQDTEAINSLKGKDIIKTNICLRNFMIWSYVVSNDNFEQWIIYAKENNKDWALLWSIFFRSNASYLYEVIKILQKDNAHIFTRFSGYVIKHLTGIDIENLNLWVNKETLPENVFDDSILSNECVPSNHWLNRQQYDLIQSGLLYPDKELLLKKLDNIKIIRDKKVINGQSIASINKNSILLYSNPVIWILKLANILAGERNSLTAVEDIFWG